MSLKEKILGGICLIAVAVCSLSILIKNTVKDNEPPVITCSKESIYASVNELHDGDMVLLKDMHAEDNKDGEITEKILVENVKKANDGKENEFEVNYVVYDAYGNMARLVRPLFITEYKKPEFICDKPLRALEGSSINIQKLLYVKDYYDGKITSGIAYNIPSDIANGSALPGFYECTASIVNSLGDKSEINFLIEIYDEADEDYNNLLNISLDNYIIYVDLNSELRPYSYINHIKDNGIVYKVDDGALYKYDDIEEYIKLNDEEILHEKMNELVTEKVVKGIAGKWINWRNIKFFSDVNTTVPGVYKGTYTYTSDNLGYTAKATAYFIVR